MSVIGNATQPMTLAIAEELDLLIKRLTTLNENFTQLSNDFGVTLDHPEMTRPDRQKSGPGLDTLRTAITEINAQIALIEQQHERLFAAKAQLFGVGDGQWHETDAPPPNTPGNYGPVRTGDFRSH